ncbi:DUF6343 family protein [Nocardioides sp. GCM10027113]|uniref:DUF6343 family protein n=1 Tax=unclassified Nocardioides TaxID=2615069 RepID=UPI0036137DBA
MPGQDGGGRGRARPGHHDPTYRLGGAAPARSALTLRLVLATFGLVACLGFAVVLWAADAATGWVVGAGVLAVVALVDAVVVVRRKRSGEPG